jgi:hypothetical protein
MGLCMGLHGITENRRGFRRADPTHEVSRLRARARHGRPSRPPTVTATNRHGHQPSRPPVARPCLPAPSFVQHLTRHQDHNRKGPLRSGRKSAFYGAEGFYLYARGGVKVKALRVSISWASLIRGRHSGEQSGQYAALVPCVHPLRPSLLLFEHLINRCVRVRIRV